MGFIVFVGTTEERNELGFWYLRKKIQIPLGSTDKSRQLTLVHQSPFTS
jgi:hypothetical protein